MFYPLLSFAVFPPYFGIPRRAFQAQQRLVRQDVCFVILFLSLSRLGFLTIFVRGSGGLDSHVSCPLAWTFFSELLPHLGRFFSLEEGHSGILVFPESPLVFPVLAARSGS